MSVMGRLFAMRRIITIVTLTAAWCALWGSVSFVNVASGIVVSAVVSVPALGTPGVGSVNIVPLMRFGFVVLRDLVASTFSVAYEVLTPPDNTDEAIVAVDLPGDSRAHLLLIVVAVTVTPGTAVIDVDSAQGRIYLHILHAERAAATAEHVEELAELACAALPVPDPTEVPS